MEGRESRVDVDRGFSSESETHQETSSPYAERPPSSRSGDYYYRSLFQEAADPMLLMNESGFLECNRAAEELFKMPSSELSSSGPWHLSPPVQPNGSSSEAASRDYVSKAMWEGPQKFDWEHVDGEGRRFLAEISLSSIEIDGMHVLQSIVRDKTEQWELEQLLRESEGRYRHMMENAVDFIFRFELHPKRGFTYVSPSAEELIGYSPEEHYQDPDLGIGYVHPDYREHVLKTFMNLTPDTPPITMLLIRKDGEYIWTEQRNIPVYDDDGRMVAVEGISRDVTERKRLQDALEESNRKLQLLCGITSHDFRNALLALNGYIELLVEQVGSPQSLLTARLAEAMDVMWSIVEFTGDYDCLQSEGKQWRSVLSMLEGQCPPDVPMEVICPDYEVYSDRMLEKVFHNLAGNTSLHAQASRAWVDCREEDGSLLILWCDDGVGIPHAEKERIFERGYGRRSGHGLYLIREMIEISGMTLREVGVPGEGAVFEIRVPAGAFRLRSDDSS